MQQHSAITRRTALHGIGTFGALSTLTSAATATGAVVADSAELAYFSPAMHKDIFIKVFQTPFIDTHEHLMEESNRLAGVFPSSRSLSSRLKSDDWTMVVNHYLNADMVSAGMPADAYDRFTAPETDPIDKWTILKPYWPAVRHTGYAQAVRIAMRELYGVEELSDETIHKVQVGYDNTRQAGFYRRILCDLAHIESCQVNSHEGTPFQKSAMPTLLMQDLNITGMFEGPDFEMYGPPAGIGVHTLKDWYQVIDWWFDTYGPYAVAVKCLSAYRRDINFEQIPAARVEGIFLKRLSGTDLNPQEQKALEDHLFWYAVDGATQYRLPVKMHTGYYAGTNKLPLSRVGSNPGSASDLCRMAPNTAFIFMHICYPCYEEMIALAKHYTNAHIDMCWAWIVNPLAALDFLKKMLVSAPVNKVLTFGGDYMPVEPVIGHAIIARRGIVLALSELVDEGWISDREAHELIDPLMHGTARSLFHLPEKEKILQSVPW